MATGRISNRSASALKAGLKDAYLWDGELAGFGLKVTPAGRSVYLVQYRLGGRAGRTRRVTIGRHGSPWTPDKARMEAKRLLGEVAAGRDPAEARTRAQRDLTVKELCDLYLSEGCSTKSPSTVLRDRSRIGSHIKPLLGSKRLNTLSRGDIERFQRDVADGKSARNIKTGPHGRSVVRGGKGAARQSLALLSAILSFAVSRGLREDNPALGVKRYKQRSMERFLVPAELARLGEALRNAERANISPTAVAAIRLLSLTGCRKSEILTLKWDHVDFERGCLRLPESKTGAKVIPLGPPAVDLLSKLSRLEGNPYVLPGANGRHFVGLQKVWEKIRKSALLADVRLHDLRHSFAGVAVAGGDSLYLVGKVLGHRQARTTERYAHLSDDPVRAVAQRAAEEIASAMDRGTEPG
ncbi:MAG TPA: tyrosine-type recombinase/integrase [Alphaproteobacteria bacterium]|nr:tyrosine-type recombinase/integrase [Alphaproteobacteria bacterium]